MKNFQRVYNVSEYVAVDEMLVPFRGREHLLCDLCDAKNGYFYNYYIYTGRGSNGESLSVHENNFMLHTQSMIRLTTPLYGSNRNITSDTGLTSVEVTDYPQKKRLAYVGTVKKKEA